LIWGSSSKGKKTSIYSATKHEVQKTRGENTLGGRILTKVRLEFLLYSRGFRDLSRDIASWGGKRKKGTTGGGGGGDEFIRPDKGTREVIEKGSLVNL